MLKHLYLESVAINVKYEVQIAVSPMKQAIIRLKNQNKLNRDSKSILCGHYLVFLVKKECNGELRTTNRSTENNCQYSSGTSY